MLLDGSQKKGRLSVFDPQAAAAARVPRPKVINTMKRTAPAVWQGDLKNGQGTLSTQSGVFK
jgi:hypothetical protein